MQPDTLATAIYEIVQMKRLPVTRNDVKKDRVKRTAPAFVNIDKQCIGTLLAMLSNGRNWNLEN